MVNARIFEPHNAKRLCFVVTASFIVKSLYKNQFKFWLDQGYEVHVVSSPGAEHPWLRRLGVVVHAITIKRRPSPLSDIVSLARLTFFFLYNDFDIVNVSTPKASLLGGLAAKLTGQRNVIYTVRGRAYENFRGLKRRLYTFMEKITCLVVARVFSISAEIAEDLARNGTCPPNKLSVIGHGSSNGVDLSKFTLTNRLQDKGDDIRSQLGVGSEDILLLYSGRIAKDKGIDDLVSVFVSLSTARDNVHLLLQGFIEHDDPPSSVTLASINRHDRIHRRDWVWDLEKYYAAADIYVFPSHREGFGNVALEASAMELPVVGFDVIGVRESVANGVSGILCPFGDLKSLENVLVDLIVDQALRLRLGAQGRKRVEDHFDSRVIWKKLSEEYMRMIEKPAGARRSLRQGSLS